MISYRLAHTYVERARGKAKEYECVWCHGHAREWANLNGDYENVRDYAPMCKSCHARFDGVGANTKHRGAAMTHCKNGHPRTDENVYEWGNWKQCRTCKREAQARYLARKRGESHHL
jgi:hypothetical protein